MTSTESPTLPAAAAAICEHLDHQFADSALLIAALTHPSWRNENAEGGQDNQRLEFLGDAVIDLIVARHLYGALSDCGEGVLTVLKSSLVSEAGLAAVAREIGLGAALRLGKGEQRHGGRELPSVLSDALEALLGALLIDAGYGRTRDIALQLFAEPLAQAIARGESYGDEPEEVHIDVANWKTAIQEQLQAVGEQPPKYLLVGEEGPAHDRRFTIRAESDWRGQTLIGDGVGRSKKAAESRAAKMLFDAVQGHVAAAKDERGADLLTDASPVDGDPSGI